MSREALVLLVCCCDFRDGAERLISSKSLRNAVIRAFPGLFRILRMCAPRRAAAVVRPRGREKSADRRRRILISRLLIIRASVPRRKSPFPAYFKGFPAVSPLIPPYPAFLKYPVSPHNLLDKMEAQGLKGMAYMENGMRQVTSNVSAINSVADFKGVKLRTMQNNNHMESFSALGANPTPVAFSELYISLSQKVVDAQENPIANVTDKKLYEVQKYLSLTNHIYDAMPLVCNLEFFNSLPQAYQKVVQAGAIYAQEFSRFCNLEREDLILADLADKYGMQINEVSADARAEMAKVAQPAVIKLVAKDIGQDAVDQYMNDVKDVLAQISKF